MNKKSAAGARNFANENYLSHKTLITIADIKHQFLEFLVDIGFVAVNLGGRRRTGQDNVYEITGSDVKNAFHMVKISYNPSFVCSLIKTEKTYVCCLRFCAPPCTLTS